MGEFNDFGLAHRTLAETLAERGRLVGFEKGQLLIERLDDGKLVGVSVGTPCPTARATGRRRSTSGSR